MYFDDILNWLNDETNDQTINDHDNSSKGLNLTVISQFDHGVVRTVYNTVNDDSRNIQEWKPVIVAYNTNIVPKPSSAILTIIA